MEFVPYDQFNNVEFIVEGGFSKIYKATWINGSISEWNRKDHCRQYIIYRDFHSGNIFFDSYNYAVIGDLGISKSATETESAEDNEIMKTFWDRNHDTELIIEICDGLRPPIVINAPEGYIDLMKECWHADPEKRPTTIDLYFRVVKMRINESRSLSGIIQSAISLRSSRSQSITSEIEKYNNTICTMDSLTYQTQFSILIQVFIINGVLTLPPLDIIPQKMEAEQLQITNVQIISDITDMLLKAAAPQAKIQYKNLAKQVNEMVKNRHARR
ncbi:hypothetical protein C1645_873635 [Glomus cerebriforme]|uniref:Kinase-like domain-containing protein n=1 Tax=Glomus cerebriforme TaxID=658196 RepID=A0A397TA03_9GLOM|nr:hypothetical protein C1645_873635 [Glomus cerebriforme]